MLLSRTFAIQEINQKMGQPINQRINMATLEYRMRVMMEEMRELAIAGDQLNTAMFQKRGPEFIREKEAAFLKELVDVAYTLEGTAVTFGYDMDKAFELVHESNMTKQPGESRFHKWVKGADYKAADVTPCLPNKL